MKKYAIKELEWEVDEDYLISDNDQLGKYMIKMKFKMGYGDAPPKGEYILSDYGYNNTYPFNEYSYGSIEQAKEHANQRWIENVERFLNEII